jgi:hypothetical protein
VKIQHAKRSLISKILDIIAVKATNSSAKSAQLPKLSMKIGTVKPPRDQSADPRKSKRRSKLMKTN